MVLSKRERILALAAIVVLGALALNSLVIDPLWQSRQATADNKLQLEAQVAEARTLFDRRRLLERKWKGLLSEGLHNDADAESRVARALNEWSRQTMLTLTSVKPERATSDKGMNEITFVVAGQGSLEAVASFLHKVETAELPVKVTRVTLGSRNESGDSMSLDLRISAIYLGAPKGAGTPSQQVQPEANHEEQVL